jgi:hypothetical protein
MEYFKYKILLNQSWYRVKDLKLGYSQNTIIITSHINNQKFHNEIINAHSVFVRLSHWNSYCHLILPNIKILISSINKFDTIEKSNYQNYLISYLMATELDFHPRETEKLNQYMLTKI